MRTTKETLAQTAKELGFEAFGVASVEADLRETYFRKWIAEGKNADMAWLDNPKRFDLLQVQAQCRSVVVVGSNYFQPPPTRQGRIATYALGRDYHKLLPKKLEALCTEMEKLGGQQKWYVDTGPVLEKRFAAATTIGWQGKNTMLISEDFGNWLFLGVILTTLELPAEPPHPDRCGSCTRCMDVCPTQAIVAPYQLDARRCIAYLTIEHKGAIPMEFREAIGDRLFGCEECLRVCPWNKWARVTHEAHFTPKDYPSARAMLSWNEDDMLKAMAGTPLKRLGLARLKRNACMVVGNTKDKEALPALEKLSQEPNEPDFVRESVRWAIEKIATKEK